MSFAEFTAVVDRRAAWGVLFKVGVAIIGGCATLFTLLIGPVLWIYTLKYGADGVEGVRKDQARLETQVNELTRTVGILQITVAGVVSEMKTSRSDQARDLGDIKDGIKALQQRSAPLPARTANVPIRRSTQ